MDVGIEQRQAVERRARLLAHHSELRGRRNRMHGLRMDEGPDEFMAAAAALEDPADRLEHMAVLHAMRLQAEENRTCAACLEKNKQYSRDEMRLHPAERRCETCVREGRRCAKRFHPHPVSSFFNKVFGADEQKKFDAWMDENKKLLDVLDGDEDYEKEMNDFDRILGCYNKEYFSLLCKEVDADCLYPLQKAIELNLNWEQGVYHIYLADEEVISFTHPVTMLLPFQMAATVSFELCFQILRQTPQHALEKLRDPLILHMQEKPLPLVFAQTDDGGYVYSSSSDDDDEYDEMDDDLNGKMD